MRILTNIKLTIVNKEDLLEKIAQLTKTSELHKNDLNSFKSALYNFKYNISRLNNELNQSRENFNSFTQPMDTTLIVQMSPVTGNAEKTQNSNNLRVA